MCNAGLAEQRVSAGRVQKRTGYQLVFLKVMHDKGQAAIIDQRGSNLQAAAISANFAWDRIPLAPLQFEGGGHSNDVFSNPGC
eukprot:1156266-Pelagomonas_calceolata.AAC.3